MTVIIAQCLMATIGLQDGSQMHGLRHNAGDCHNDLVPVVNVAEAEQTTYKNR
jgi:hypothetical protein